MFFIILRIFISFELKGLYCFDKNKVFEDFLLFYRINKNCLNIKCFVKYIFCKYLIGVMLMIRNKM